MLRMCCARRGLSAAGQLLIWGQSWGVIAYLQLCLARTEFLLGGVSMADAPPLELFACAEVAP
jgi:hypothetical protein